FVVYDSDSQCVYMQESDVPVYTESDLVATVETVTNISCTGAADGSVDATVSGYGGANVGWEVFTNITNIPTGHNGTVTGAIGGPESLTINGLSPGEFYILFTEEDGCVVASESFIIEQSPRLLEITANSPVN